MSWLKKYAVSAVAAGVLGAASPLTAAEFNLRLGHDQTDGHPYDVGVKKFAADLKARTEGAIEIKIFPAAQLGNSAEQIEGLRLGTLDLALSAFSHASQFCKELGLFGAPFLFQDDAHFAKVFDGSTGQKLDQACKDRYGIRLLSTFTSGYRLLFNRRRQVKSEGDLKGLKIRVMGGEADALTWKVFGAIPSPMPYSEVYSALQAGVIDGAENEPASILANKFYEAAPYFALTKHLVLPMGLFMSERLMQKLPEAHRKAIFEEAHSAAIFERAYITKKNEEALETMRTKYNVKINTVDEGALRGKGQPIQDMVAKRLGAEAMLAEIRALAK